MLISAYRAVWLHGGISGLTVLVAFMLGGGEAALAAAFGVVTAMVNTGLLWWRWRRGAKELHCDGGRHLRSFYRSSLERFFVVGMLLALGFVLLELAPLALLAGFVVGQLAGMVAGWALCERT